MRKAQIAVEYILIMGFVLFVLMSAMYIFRGYAISSMDRIIENKVDIVAHALIDNAREIYYLGEGSKKIVTVEMPEQVVNITALNVDGEYYLIFNITISTGQKELFYESDVQIRNEKGNYIDTPDCYGSSGTTCYFYYFKPEEISPGIKNFKVEAKKDTTNYVDIEMVSLK